MSGLGNSAIRGQELEKGFLTSCASAEPGCRWHRAPSMDVLVDSEADMKKIAAITGIVIALLIVVLAVPTKVICPNGPYATAPDAQGNVHRYYEMKPLGATLVEEATGFRISIHYTSGLDTESIS
ncbi:Uncharacterised protein [Mycobacteroides abscessus subsp. bolletii]|nr:Uncharacterised protein [Mycobacteroides abscessus subsp. bolletii]